MSDLLADNLSRIRVRSIRNSSASRHNVRVEESVQNPVYTYWRQQNPLLMSANSFLTRIHMVHRLKWLLRPSGSPTAGDGFSRFMNQLGSSFSGMNRKEIEHILTVMVGEATDTTATERPIIALAAQATSLKPEVAPVIQDAVKDLRQSLNDMPEASLNSGLAYLCKQMDADFRFPAQQALDQISAALAMTLTADNVRGFVVARRKQNELCPRSIKEKLDKSAWCVRRIPYLVCASTTTGQKRANIYRAGQRNTI